MHGSPNSTRPHVALAARSWAHLMPAARGSIVPDRFDLSVDLRATTPHPHGEGPATAVETSLSGHLRALAAGDDRRVGLPVFLMRAFRHRCFLVPLRSELTDLTHLRGRTVGITGWPDSGNTWTRALLRRAGVGLDEVRWVLAPLHGGELEPSRMGRLPDGATVVAGGASLFDALEQGQVDAVMAPFVPHDLGAHGHALRHLLPDYAEVEAAYFAELGFIPGIHLVTLPRELAEQHPWLPVELVGTLQRSFRAWQTERRYYADTTPWMVEDLRRTEAVVGRDWMPCGVEENAAMVAAFCAEMTAQHLIDEPLDPALAFHAYQSLTDPTFERA